MFTRKIFQYYPHSLVIALGSGIFDQSEFLQGGKQACFYVHTQRQRDMEETQSF